MERPGFHVMIHRDGALESRRWHIPLWAVRVGATLGAAVALGVITIVVLYGPIVSAAGRTPFLARRIGQLEAENRRVTELARRLDEAEARYAHLRSMMGGNVALPEMPTAVAAVRTPDEDGLHVAPAILARAPGDSALEAAAGPGLPSRWPLTVPSFRTRGLAQGDPGIESHMGVDLAVPVGSDVRASGGGVVLESGTDSAYGQYVLLDHTDGYQSMYGHLSRILVRRGAQVRAGQVIALSGNTGRSTAPHLHFEIRRNGRSVDPLTLVREGS